MTSARPTTPDRHRRDRQRMQQHLRENLSDSSLSVAASSAALFMSVRYVQKVFAQAGTTPMAWLVDCRIGEARRLLGETSLPIGEVARMVGYRDTAQFSRSFKSRTGCSPSAFRGGRSTSIS